jgi:hypothetical protein
MDAFLAQGVPLVATAEARLIRYNLYKTRAEVLVKTRQYQEALSMYMEAVAAITGKYFVIPLIGGLRSYVYVKLSHWERVDLMACCNGIAQCMVKQKDVEGVSMLKPLVLYLLLIIVLCSPGKLWNGSKPTFCTKIAFTESVNPYLVSDSIYIGFRSLFNARFPSRLV